MATVCAVAALAGTAWAYPDVGALDFGTSFAKVAEANPDVSRLNLSWRGVDNTVRGIDSPLRTCDDRGVYNWCNIDAALRRFAVTRTPVHLVLVGVPEWAERPGCDVHPHAAAGSRVNACSPAPEHLGEWRAFVMNAVRRYGPDGYFWDRLGVGDESFDVRGWEVWNEPDQPQFWNGYRPEGKDPDRFTERMVSQYVELFRETDAAIEAASAMNGPGPDAWTVGPSVALEGDVRWEREFARRPEADRLDRVSLHPYDDTTAGAEADVAMVHELLPGRPVWITEHGFGAGPSSVRYNVGSAEAQRDQFVEFLDAIRLRHPYVSRYVYFNGLDNQTDPPPPERGAFDEMGLYTDDGQPKPILEAFQAQVAPGWIALADTADAAGRLAASLEAPSE